MREIRPSSLEGGVRLIPHPYPYRERESNRESDHQNSRGQPLKFELCAWTIYG